MPQWLAGLLMGAKQNTRSYIVPSDDTTSPMEIIPLDFIVANVSAQNVFLKEDMSVNKTQQVFSNITTSAYMTRS